MLTLGDETFIADAVMLGDESIDGGWMSMQPTVIARRSFVGNGSYIPDGTILPQNVLIGVHSTVPSNDEIQDGDTWLGSPPIHLPARETVSGFPETLTFRPSILRRLARGLIEAFPEMIAGDVARLIEGVVAEHFAVTTTALVRTPPELAAVVARGDSFEEPFPEPSRRYVALLAAEYRCVSAAGARMRRMIAD